MSVRGVKGTRDLLPPETAIWSAVEGVVRRVFGAYGYSEIRTPVLEQTELFVRGVGESTDIVGKEMYTFADRKGRSLSLRPESTAAVARAYVQHGLAQWTQPVKLYYIGPHFRYERPQRGRYREFHQIGAELIGDMGPHSDAELLTMLVRFLRELGFEDLEVRLNTVGDRASRARFSEALRAFLVPQKSQLGDDSRRRLETNPLRILDTKIEAEQELLKEAPRLDQFISPECLEHFASLCALLDAGGVSYVLDDRLVRGLDYYTRTVFEIASKQLGAQDAILGGGRYDGLIAELGGNEVPGIGFAIGQDRLIDVLPESFRHQQSTLPAVFVVAVGGLPPDEALRLSEEIRDQGVPVVTELAGGSTKGALKRAGRSGCRYVALVGDDEVATGVVTVKDFSTSEQQSVARAEIGPWLREKWLRANG